MGIMNCLNCGKVILETRIDLCKDCLREQEKDFRRVKDYLLAHPRASLMEVIQRTGVSLKTVKELTTGKR